MNWFLLVILSAVTLAVATLLQRILLKEKESDPVAYAILFGVLCSLLIFAFALLRGFSLSGISNFLPNVALMSILYAAGNLLFFKALKISEVSEITVVRASSSIWTALGAFLFLQEKFIITTILGTLLVVAGIVVVSYKRRSWKLNQGHLFALFSAIFFGFAFVNDSFIVKTLDVPSYIGLAFLTPSVVLALTQPKSLKSLRLFMNKKRLIKMLTLALFYSASALAIFFAITSGGPASQVYPIGQSYVILTVVLAVIFLKERGHLINKILGAILVFLGVALLR